MPRCSVKYAPEELQENKDLIDYYNKISDGLGSVLSLAKTRMLAG